MVNHPDFLAIYNSIIGDSTEKLYSSLSKAPNSILPGLYWWGKNLAHYLNSRPVIERLSSRELLEVIMNRVLTLDPSFHYGGAYRFFGMLYTRIPGIYIEQSFSYFNQAIKSNPHYLSNSVFLADFYHQKSGNREQFNKILSLTKEIIKGNKGAWYIDKDKSSNYNLLSASQKSSLNKQIEKMIKNNV